MIFYSKDIKRKIKIFYEKMRIIKIFSNLSNAYY